MAKATAIAAFILLDALALVFLLPVSSTSVNGNLALIGILIGAVLCLFILSKPYIGVIATIVALPIQSLYPDIPIGTSILSILGAVTLVSFFLHKRFTFKSVFHPDPVHIWSIAFVIWLFISDPLPLGSTRNWFFTYIQLLIFMWLSAQLLTPRRQRQLMILYLFMCIVSAIAGTTQGQLTTTINTTVRAEGFTTNANEFAMYLVFAICFLVYFLASYRSAFIAQVILLSGLVVLILGVVFSASRTGAISLGVVLIFVVALFPKLSSVRVQSQRISSVFNVIILGFFLWIVATVVVPSEYWSILGEAQNLLQLGTQATKGTVVKRLDFWQEAIQLWERRPILGIGAGQALVDVDHVVHNMYLTVLVEQGIIGFILYLLWLGCVLYNLVRVVFTSSNVEDVALATCWLLVMITVMVFGVTNSFHYFKFPWLIAGISTTFFVETRSKIKVSQLALEPIKRKG